MHETAFKQKPSPCSKGASNSDCKTYYSEKSIADAFAQPMPHRLLRNSRFHIDRLHLIERNLLYSAIEKLRGARALVIGNTATSRAVGDKRALTKDARDLRRLSRAQRSLPKGAAVLPRLDSRGDDRWRTFRGSRECWVTAGEGRLTQPAWAWHRGARQARLYWFCTQTIGAIRWASAICAGVTLLSPI